MMTMERKGSRRSRKAKGGKAKALALEDEYSGTMYDLHHASRGVPLVAAAVARTRSEDSEEFPDLSASARGLGRMHSSSSILSEDDKKLPAFPRDSRAAFAQKQRKPISMPYIKNYVSPTKSQPDLYPKPSAIREESAPPEMAPSRKDSDGKKSPPLRGARGIAKVPEPVFSKQGSFYKAAMDALKDADEPATTPQPDHVAEDEKLARELMTQLEAIPAISSSKSDEDFARRLQDGEDQPAPLSSEVNEQDIALALKLMHESGDKLNATDTSEQDVALALKLMQESGDQLNNKDTSEEDVALALKLMQGSADRLNNDTNDEDAALALRLMEEEKLNNDTSGGDARFARQLMQEHEGPTAAMRRARDLDTSADAALARRMMRESEPVAQLDTSADAELARRLMRESGGGGGEPAVQDSNNEDVDVALALRLMQEEVTPTQTQQTDEQLAMQLSQQLVISNEPPMDAMIAHQLSQSTIQPATTALPEQLQILERIQQDAERQEIEKALQASSLNELPQFQEQSADFGMMPITPDSHLGGGSMHSMHLDAARDGAGGRGSTIRDQDFMLSQQLAMREWTDMVDQRRNSGGSLPTRRDGIQSWSGGEHLSSSRPASFASPSSNFQPILVPPDLSQRQSQSFRVNPNPRSGHPDLSLQRQTQSFRTTGNSRPGMAVSVDPSGLETSITPTRNPVARARTLSGRPPMDERGREALTPQPGVPVGRGRSHPDVTRASSARPPDDVLMLRRGTQETQSAINRGNAHVVICQGCNSRLHAPMNYSLVFCPNCSAVSPGLAADNPQAPGGSGVYGNVQNATSRWQY